MINSIDMHGRSGERSEAVANDAQASWLEDQASDAVILPGFRFHPTDEELVGFYLRRKVEKKDVRVQIIRETDLYDFHPWDLATKQNAIGAADKEWYFYCLRRKKYPNSVRPNRVTARSGFWKATGIDQKIWASAGDCIGLKKCLVYYLGSAGKGSRKTNWMMHEFRLRPQPQSTSRSDVDATTHDFSEVENWTICRIFKRNDRGGSSSTTAPTQSSCSDVIANHLDFHLFEQQYLSVHEQYHHAAVMDPGLMQEEERKYHQYQHCCDEPAAAPACTPPPPEMMNFTFPAGAYDGFQAPGSWVDHNIL